jgi:DNA-binding winged helix-turn-helix (wHTH) protein/tetratricopeptide (TPR) repeat protein
MSEEFSGQWQFGEFRLDARAKVLRHRGTAVAMPLKELEVLCMLVENQGELVTKQAMLDEIWEDSFVGESNLSRHIYLLRKTLKDAGADEGLIENVPRRGYRFAGEVRSIEPDEIYVEKRTRTRTLVEFQDARETPALGRIRIAAFASLLLIATVASAIVGYRYLAAPNPEPAITSLAILPFRVVDTGPATSHSGVGLADILTTRLSNIKNVRVRPIGTSPSGEGHDPVAMGRQMQVDAVLEGTIYYSNEKVRVTARLVRVSDASVEWSGEFEKLKKDEVQLQNELARQIIPALAVNLSGDEHDAVTKHYTQNADAYELYLKGRYEWSKRSYPGMVEAQRQFRNAIAADPGFALAYVGLADTLLTDQPSASEAWAVLTKALELDPNIAEAHASKGFYLMFLQWRWNEAEAAFQKSLDLNPNYATAHHWYATLLAIKGDTEAAKVEMRKALELDPASYNFLADLGQLYYFSGDYAEAEKHCLKALEIYPEFTRAHEYLHYIYLKTGQYDKAITEIAKADDVNSAYAHEISMTHDSLGRYSEAFRSSGINGYFELRYPGTPTGPEALYFYAIKYAVIGNNEKALEYLERSTESRMFMSAFVKADPIFEGLRSEHRYQEILRKMGLG